MPRMSEEFSITINTEPLAFPIKEETKSADTSNTNEVVTRRRSNSQSQVIAMPTQGLLKVKPPRRKRFHYVVTMTSLNETFAKKVLTVPYFPDIRRLGRPAGVKIKPDTTNGYFDSRVLSRNHAAMYVDPDTGKLMLKDMGSSNGTYVNEQKIGTDAVEIEIGDIIYLGFNIQVDTNHKQISAKIENISIQVNTPNIPEKGIEDKSSTEYAYSEFLQGVCTYINKEKSSQKCLYDMDEALFGDFNPDFGDYEFEGSNASGRFRNSRIVRSLTVEDVISRLNDSLVRIDKQNQVLSSIENFVENYRLQLDDMNSNYLNSVIESTKSKYENMLMEERRKIEDECKKSVAIKQKLDDYTIKSKSEIESLNKKLSHLEEEKLSLIKSLDELKQHKIDDQHNGNDRKSNDKILINNSASEYTQNGNTIEDNIDIDLSVLNIKSQHESDIYRSVENVGHNPSSIIENGYMKKEAQPQTTSSKTSNSTTITPPMSDTEEIKKLEDEEDNNNNQGASTKDISNITHSHKLSEPVPNSKLYTSASNDFKRSGVYVSLLVIFLGFIFDRFSK